jgi:Mrp family chromosome partitioning ATPase
MQKVIVQDYRAGLVEALTGSVPLDGCLSRDPKSDAFVLPCLATPPNPADMLNSEAMRVLISRLQEVFDAIVIDSPPLLPVNDSKILSRLSDAVLFVVRWEKTPREAVMNAARALADAHAIISGVAISRADSERFNYYSYGYQDYQEYNKYYSA